nr:hypothetical protein BaRGS_008037 [Batillaria attramentaria]KAG5703635.1 hypothetical protein BaRGS_002509 [Batillaria attramentaria]
MPTYMAILNIILILGVLGNCLVFVAASDSFIRKFSYSVFLRALAISDTLVLITICTEDNLDYANRLQNFLASSVGLCKMWTGLSTTVSLLSPWLVVLLSVDRYVGVVFPLKRASYCTLKVAGISIAVMTAVVMITRIPDVVFNTVLPEDGIPRCHIDIGSSSYIGYLQFSTIILASTIPCVLILGFNLRLLYALKKDVRLRLDVPEGVSLSSKVDRTTVSLMVVSAMAFLTLVPKTLLEVIELTWQVKYDKAEEAALQMNQPKPVYPHGLLVANKTWPVLNLIYLMNFAQNFYILMFTSPRIRNVIRQKLCGRCCPLPEESAPIARMTLTHGVDGVREEYALLAADEF